MLFNVLAVGLMFFNALVISRMQFDPITLEVGQFERLGHTLRSSSCTPQALYCLRRYLSHVEA